MPISDTQKARLLARQEEIFEYFMEHSDPQSWPDIAKREERGDLKWHTVIVSQILGIVVRIEQLLPRNAGASEDQPSSDQDAEAIVKEGERLAKRMLRRVK